MRSSTIRPSPRAMIEVVDPDNPDRVVEYGETGRVRLTTLTREFFMPRFLERDEAEREAALRPLPVGRRAQRPAVLPISDHGGRRSILTKDSDSKIQLNALGTNRMIIVQCGSESGFLCFTYLYLEKAKPIRVSMLRALPHHRTREPFVEISQANSGLIRRDLLDQQRGRQALAALSTAELLEICAQAADHFINDALPHR